jgi:hypothetical protein
VKKTHPIANRVSALFLPVAAGAVLGLALACLLVPVGWDDQSFYIYAAPRLLDGYHLYSADLQDTNPPLIAWMTMIPAAFARASGLAPDVSFVLFVFLLISGAVVWSLCLSRDSVRMAGKSVAPWLAVFLVYLTIVLPSVSWKVHEVRDAFGMAIRYDFGQREHIMVLLILPYLFAAVRRFDQRGLAVFEAVVIGFVAALGFSLKPQYLTVAFGVEALLIYRTRSLRCLIRPEWVALVLGGLIYCAIVWLLTPAYITTVIPTVAGVYGDFSHKTAMEIMATSKYNVALVVFAGIAWILQRGSGVERLAAIFLIAGAAAFISFLLQGKGWTDHLLPSEMFILLALAASAIGHFLQWVNRRGGGEGRPRDVERGDGFELPGCLWTLLSGTSRPMGQERVCEADGRNQPGHSRISGWYGFPCAGGWNLFPVRRCHR